MFRVVDLRGWDNESGRSIPIERTPKVAERLACKLLIGLILIFQRGIYGNL